MGLDGCMRHIENFDAVQRSPHARYKLCIRQYYWWRILIGSSSHGLLPELSTVLDIDGHRRSRGLGKDLKQRQQLY